MGGVSEEGEANETTESGLQSKLGGEEGMEVEEEEDKAGKGTGKTPPKPSSVGSSSTTAATPALSSTRSPEEFIWTVHAEIREDEVADYEEIAQNTSGAATISDDGRSDSRVMLKEQETPETDTGKLMENTNSGKNSGSERGAGLSVGGVSRNAQADGGAGVGV
jgi:hypothetical protein